MLNVAGSFSFFEAARYEFDFEAVLLYRVVWGTHRNKELRFVFRMRITNKFIKFSQFRVEQFLIDFLLNLRGLSGLFLIGLFVLFVLI